MMVSVALASAQSALCVCVAVESGSSLLCPTGPPEFGGVRGRAAPLGRSPLLPAGQPEIQGHSRPPVPWLLH